MAFINCSPIYFFKYLLAGQKYSEVFKNTLAVESDIITVRFLDLYCLLTYFQNSVDKSFAILALDLLVGSSDEQESCNRKRFTMFPL